MTDKERVEEIGCEYCQHAMTKCNHCGEVFSIAHKRILEDKEKYILKLEAEDENKRLEICALRVEVKRLEEESAILKEDLRGIDEATKAAIAFKIKEWKDKCAKVAESFQRQTSQNPRWIADAIRDLPEGD